jgi:hypothetical protein
VIRRVLVALLLLPCLALGLVPFVDWGCAHERLPRPDYSALERQGDALVQAIRAFEEARGRAPATLEECGLTAPDTAYGPWRYSPKPNWPGRTDVTWHLSVGDYMRDGFALWWDPKTGWYRDT